MARHSGRGACNLLAARQTESQSRPISVVSNSTHSQLERPINSLTGATLVRHLAKFLEWEREREPTLGLWGGSALPLGVISGRVVGVCHVACIAHLTN